MLRDRRRTSTAARPTSTAAATRSTSPLRFEIHPDDLFRIYDGDRGARRGDAAIYHSHPKTEGGPSQTDVNLAADWPGIVWIDLLAGGPRGRASAAFAIDGHAVDGGRARCRVRPGAGRAARLPDAARASTRSSERFCADCEMPLVYVGRGEEEPITEAHERARKVKPQYTGGDP